VQSPTRATEQARTQLVASQTPPDQSHLERLDEGNKPHRNTLHNLPLNYSKSQCKDAMNSANRDEKMRAMNTPHHNKPYIQESGNSTAAIGRNREATLEDSASVSLESRMGFRSTSGQFRNKLTSGVCSPSDSAPPTEIPEEMNVGIAGEENFGENGVRNIRKDETSSNNTGSQAKANHHTRYSGHL
ncbi:hypothetical protein EJD97_014210, partial [Solanum chilense]